MAYTLLILMMPFLPLAFLFWWLEPFVKKCDHGVRGGGGRSHCQGCDDEREALELAAAAFTLAYELKKRATTLRQGEIRRLRSGLTPQINELRNASPQNFEDVVARVFREHGYDVKQTPYSGDEGRDAIMYRDGEKYLVECKRYNGTTVGRPDLQRFHSSIITDKAQKGFFVSLGPFSEQAVTFARSVGVIELIGEQQFMGFIHELETADQLDDSYRSQCPDCEDEVTHHLRSPREIVCSRGHSVVPTIHVTDVFEPQYAQSTSRGCPRCGSEMRLREGRNGKFWGCSTYPMCRGSRDYRKRYRSR